MIKNFAVVDGEEREIKGCKLKQYCDFCKKEIATPAAVTFQATLNVRLSALTQHFAPDICYDCASQLMYELNERSK